MGYQRPMRILPRLTLHFFARRRWTSRALETGLGDRFGREVSRERRLNAELMVSHTSLSASNERRLLTLESDNVELREAASRASQAERRILNIEADNAALRKAAERAVRERDVVASNGEVILRER